MFAFLDEIHFDAPSFWVAMASITFNPLFWNAVARNEHRTRFLSKLMGSNYRACYMLAAVIFSLGLFRDYLYSLALADQPQTLDESSVYLGGALMLIGNILVLTSMFGLGLTGTYLGDYFGIYMKEKVTAFPFSVFNDPMYQGSTMNFVGYALWHQSKAGLVLSFYVYITYQIAIAFEGPFTNEIYAKLEASKKEKLKKTK